GGRLESGEAGSAPGAPRGDDQHPPRVNAAAVIDAAEVAARLKDPGFLLVDARAPERFAGSLEPIDSVAGHVRGAVNQPFSANLAADGRFLPAAQLQELWLRRLAGRPARPVAGMCG